MITRITFGPPPPPGKYSSGNRGILSATPEHPAAPSRPIPAAPAPAALKKSLRVSALPVLSFTPEKSLRLSQKANCNRKARRFAPYQHAPYGRLSARFTLSGLAVGQIPLRPAPYAQIVPPRREAPCRSYREDS